MLRLTLSRSLRVHSAMCDHVPIWNAVEAKVSPEALQIVIDKCDGDVNRPNPATGETPILLAITNNSPSSIVKMLISAGSDVMQSDANGASLLHYAARHSCDPQTIRLLTEAGLKPTVRDAHMESPLHVAARSNPEPLVLQTLMEGDEEGRSIHFISDSGGVPLSAAVENPNPEITQVLIKNGGDLGLADHDWSPVFLGARLKWGQTIFEN